MKIEFDVNMTTANMYDYMMHHAFTGLSGWLGEVSGILLVVASFYSYNRLYLLAGIILIVYLPIALYFQSKKQVKLSPVFKAPMHYTLTEEGLEISVLEEHDAREWSAITKVISTRKNLILYTNRINATLFPKSDLGEQYDAVVEMIRSHVPAEIVKIRR